MMDNGVRSRAAAAGDEELPALATAATPRQPPTTRHHHQMRHEDASKAKKKKKSTGKNSSSSVASSSRRKTNAKTKDEPFAKARSSSSSQRVPSSTAVASATVAATSSSRSADAPSPLERRARQRGPLPPELARSANVQPGAFHVSASGRQQRDDSSSSSDEDEENVLSPEEGATSEAAAPPPPTPLIFTATLVEDDEERETYHDEVPFERRKRRGKALLAEEKTRQSRRRLYCALGAVVACLCAAAAVGVVLLFVWNNDNGSSNNQQGTATVNSTESTTTTTTTAPNSAATTTTPTTPPDTTAPTAAPVFAESIDSYDQVTMFFVPWGYNLDDCNSGTGDGAVPPVELELSCRTSNSEQPVEIFHFVNPLGDDEVVACDKESPAVMSCGAPVTTTAGGQTEAPLLYERVLLVVCASHHGVTDMTLTVEVLPFRGFGCGRDPAFNGGVGMPNEFVGEATSGVSLASLCFPLGVPDAGLLEWKWMGHGGGSCTSGHTIEVPNDRSTTHSALAVCAAMGTCFHATAKCDLLTSDAELVGTVTDPTCFLAKAAETFEWNMDLFWDEAEKAYGVDGYANQVQLALSIFGALPP